MEYIYISPMTLECDYQLERSLRIVKIAINDNIQKVDEIEGATYLIMHYSEYQNLTDSQKVRTHQRRFWIWHDDPTTATADILSLPTPKEFTWQWKYDKTKDDWYEVTTRGDRRFSPFCMLTPESISTKDRTLEDYYQRVLKPLSLNEKRKLQLELYERYFNANPELLYELAVIGYDHSFTDMFDKFGGQNRHYACYLNDFFGIKEWKYE